jgi:hypothetical protein
MLPVLTRLKPEAKIQTDPLLFHSAANPLSPARASLCRLRYIFVKIRRVTSRTVDLIMGLCSSVNRSQK